MSLVAEFGTVAIIFNVLCVHPFVHHLHLTFLKPYRSCTVVLGVEVKPWWHIPEVLWVRNNTSTWRQPHIDHCLISACRRGAIR